MAMTLVTTEGKIRGGWKGRISNLYAVIVAERANALVYEDGHGRVRFHESGNVFFVEKKPSASLNGFARDIGESFAQVGGGYVQLDIAPHFANDAEAAQWFKSIGLRLTDAGAQEELRQLGLTD